MSTWVVAFLIALDLAAPVGAGAQVEGMRKLGDAIQKSLDGSAKTTSAQGSSGPAATGRQAARAEAPSTSARACAPVSSARPPASKPDPDASAYAARLVENADSALYAFYRGTGYLNEMLRLQSGGVPPEELASAQTRAEAAVGEIRRRRAGVDGAPAPARYAAAQAPLLQALDSLTRATAAWAESMQGCRRAQTSLAGCVEPTTRATMSATAARSAYDEARFRVACLLRTDGVEVTPLREPKQ